MTITPQMPSRRERRALARKFKQKWDESPLRFPTEARYEPKTTRNSLSGKVANVVTEEKES